MTDDRIAALSNRRAARDKHPARSARVLVTGVSMSALASLVSAFNVQAANNQQAATTPLQPETLVSPLDSPVAPVTSPTMPTPATPVRHVVEVNVVQPPVATAPPQSRTGLGSIGDLSMGGGSSGGGSGIGSGGGLSGGGSSGNSGGSN